VRYDLPRREFIPFAAFILADHPTHIFHLITLTKIRSFLKKIFSLFSYIKQPMSFSVFQKKLPLSPTEKIMKVASLFMRLLHYLNDLCSLLLWMLLTYNTAAVVYIWITKTWQNYYLIPVISAFPLLIYLIPYAILMFFRAYAYMYANRPKKTEYARVLLNTICLVFSFINIIVYVAAFLLILLLYTWDPWAVSTLAPARWIEVLVLNITDGAILVFLIISAAILGISTWDFAITF
jgi:hypothetical protein